MQICLDLNVIILKNYTYDFVSRITNISRAHRFSRYLKQ